MAGDVFGPVGRHRLEPAIFHHGQGLIVHCGGCGGLYPQGGQVGVSRGGRWPVERGPGMFVFVVSFTTDTVSRLLLLRLRLPLVREFLAAPRSALLPQNCISQQLPLPSLRTARRSRNVYNSIGVLKALIGAVLRV